MNFIKRIVTDKILLFCIGLLIIFSLMKPLSFRDVNLDSVIDLGALMLLISVFESGGFISSLSGMIVNHSHNTRQLIWRLILITFVGASFLTNDVLILTSIPVLLKITDKIGISAGIPVSLLCIAANLGSSITPFGNPQNLFLVSHYQLTMVEFLWITWPMMIISLGLLWCTSLLIKKQNIKNERWTIHMPKWQWLWLLLPSIGIEFISILGFLPTWIGLVVAIVTAIALKRDRIAHIDYAVLLTFVCFFLITGIVSRLNGVSALIETLRRVPHGSYFGAILSSQIISNVPAAILLAKFTTAAQDLILGVNVGGLGTLVASLANLLALKQYLVNTKEPHITKMMLVFGTLNGIFLIVLSVSIWLIL